MKFAVEVGWRVLDEKPVLLRVSKARFDALSDRLSENLFVGPKMISRNIDPDTGEEFETMLGFESAKLMWNEIEEGGHILRLKVV